MEDKNLEIFDIDVKEGNRIGRRLASTIGQSVRNAVRGASTGRRGLIGRINEPFDPNALDGDGDMLVQDGTVWERPVTSPAQIPKPTILQDVTGDPTGDDEDSTATREAIRKRGRQAPERPQPRKQGSLTQRTARSAANTTPDRIDFWRTATIDEIVDAAVPDSEAKREEATIQVMVGDRSQYDSDQAFEDAKQAARAFHEMLTRLEQSSFNALRKAYDDRHGAGSFDADADNPQRAQERMREQFGSQTAYRALISNPTASLPQLSFLTLLATDPNAPQDLRKLARGVLLQVDQNVNSPTYGMVELPEVFGAGVMVNPIEAIIASAVTQARGLSFTRTQRSVPTWQDMMFNYGLTLSQGKAQVLDNMVNAYFNFIRFMQQDDPSLMQTIGLDKVVPPTAEQFMQRLTVAIYHMDTRVGTNGMLLPDRRKQIFNGQGFMNLMGIPSYDPRDIAHTKDILKRTLENNPEMLAAVRVVGLPVISKTHRILDKHVHGGLMPDRVPDSILDGTATEGERQRWEKILQSREDGRISGKRPDGFTDAEWESMKHDALPEYIGAYTTASGHYTFDLGVLHLEGSTLNNEAAKVDSKDNDFAKGKFKYTNLDTVEIASDEGLLMHEFGHYLHNVLLMALDQLVEEIRKLIEDPNSDLHKRLFPNATSSSPASSADKEAALLDHVAKVILAGGGFGGHLPMPNDVPTIENGIAQKDTQMMSAANKYTRKSAIQMMMAGVTGVVAGQDDYPRGRRIFDPSTMSPNEIEERFAEVLDILRIIMHDKSLMEVRQRAGELRDMDRRNGAISKKERSKRHTARIKAIRDAAQGSQEPYVNTEYGNVNEHERFAEMVISVLSKNGQNRPILVNDAAVQLIARILGLDVELDMNAMEMSRTQRDGTIVDATHLVSSTVRAVSPELRRQTHGHRPNLSERGAQSRSEMARFDPDERSRMAQSRSNIGMDTDSRLYAYDEPISITHRRSGATVYSIGDHHFYVNKGGYPTKQQRDVDGFEAAMRYVSRNSVHEGDMMRYISSTLFGLFLDDMNVHDTTTEWDKATMRGLVSGEIAGLSANQRSVIEQALQGAVAIHHSIQDATPSKKQMFRHLSFDPKFFGDNTNVGDELPMPISAFTTEPMGNVGGVVLVLRPGAKAVEAIANLHLTAGTFKVVAKRMNGSTLVIELDHTETMDLKHQAMRPVDPLLDTAENMRQLGFYRRRYTVREAQAMEDDKTKRFHKNNQQPMVRGQELISRGARSSSGENIEDIGVYVDGRFITPWTEDNELHNFLQSDAREKLRKTYPDYEEAPTLVVDRAVDNALTADVANLGKPVSVETAKIRQNRGKYGTKIFGWITTSTRKRLSKARKVVTDRYQGATPWVEDGYALKQFVALSGAQVREMGDTLRTKMLSAVTEGRVVRPDGTPGKSDDISYAQRELLDEDGNLDLTMGKVVFNSTTLRHFLATGELLLFQSDSGFGDYSRTRRNDRKNRLVIPSVVNPVTPEDRQFLEYLGILLRTIESIERAYFLDGSYRNQTRDLDKHDLRGIVPFEYTRRNRRNVEQQRTHLMVSNRHSSISDGEDDGVSVGISVRSQDARSPVSTNFTVKAGFYEVTDAGNGEFERGDEVGSSERLITISHDNHTLSIKHQTAFLDRNFQDFGWGTAWNQHAWLWFKQIAGAYAHLGAASDGPLVWPRLGFEPKYPDDIRWERILKSLKLALFESDETIPPDLKEAVRRGFRGIGTSGGGLRNITRDTLKSLFLPESQEGAKGQNMRSRIATFVKLLELDLLSGDGVDGKRLVMLANLITPRTMDATQTSAWLTFLAEAHDGQVQMDLSIPNREDDPDFLPPFIIDSPSADIVVDETMSTDDKVVVRGPAYVGGPEIVSTVVRDALNGTRPSEVPRDMLMPHPELIDADLEPMGGYGPGGRDPRRDDARFATVTQEQASRLNQILGPFGEDSVPQSPRANIISTERLLPDTPERISAEKLDGTSPFMLDTLETAREIAGFVGAPEIMTRRDLMAHRNAEISYSVIPDSLMNLPLSPTYIDEINMAPATGRDGIGRTLSTDATRTENVSRFLTGRNAIPELQLVSTRDPISQIYHLTSFSTREIPAEPADNPYGVVHVRKSFTRTTSGQEMLDIAQRLLGGSQVADRLVAQYKRMRSGDSTATIDGLTNEIIASLLGPSELLGDAPMVDGRELSFDDVQGGRIVQSRMNLLRMNTLESILTHLNEQQLNDAVGIAGPHTNDYTRFPFLVDASRFTTDIQRENEDRLHMDFRGEAQSARQPEFRVLEGVYRVVYLLAALNNQQENMRIERGASNAQVIVDELKGIQKGLAHLLIRTAAGDTLSAQTLAVLLGFDEYVHDGRTPRVTTRTMPTSRGATLHRRSQHAALGDRTLGGTHGVTILNVGSRVFMDEPVSVREAARIADAVGNPMRRPGPLASTLVRNAMNQPKDWEIRADWFVSGNPQEWRSNVSPLDISERRARSASFIRQVRQDWGTDIREEPGERGARSDSNRRRAIKAREDLRYGQVRWTSTDEEFNNLLNDLRSRYAALSEELDALENEQTDDDESIADPYYTDYLDKVEEITRKQQEIEDQIAALVNTSNRVMTTAIELDASIEAIDEAMEVLKNAGVASFSTAPGPMLPEGVGKFPEVFSDRIAAMRADLVRRRAQYDLAQARRRHKKITDLLDDEFDINWGVQNSKTVDPVYLEDFDDFDHEWQKETTTKYLIEGFINPDFDPDSGIYTELDSTRDEWKAIFAGMTRETRETFKANYDRYLDNPEFYGQFNNPQYEEDIVSATRPSATSRPDGVPIAVWRKIRAAISRARSTNFEGERDNAYDAATRLLSRHRPDLANDSYVRSLRSSSGTPSGLIRSKGVNRSAPSMRGSAPDTPSRPVAQRPVMRLMAKLKAMGVDIDITDFTHDLSLPPGLTEEQKAERKAIKRLLHKNHTLVVEAFVSYRDDFPGALEKIEQALAKVIQEGRGDHAIADDYRLERVAMKMAMATMELMREDGLELMPIEGHAPKAKKVVGAIDTDIVDVVVDDVDVAMIRTQGAPTLEQIFDIQAWFRAEVLRLHRMFGGKDRETRTVEYVPGEARKETVKESPDVFYHLDDAFRVTMRKQGETKVDELVYYDAAANEVVRAPRLIIKGDLPATLSPDARAVIDSLSDSMHTTLAGFVDSITFDDSMEVNDAIFHAMLEEMGMSVKMDSQVPKQGWYQTKIPDAPLARMRAYLEAAEYRASKFEFAATPAGDYVKNLVKQRIDRLKMLLEMTERLGQRYVQNMRDHGMSDKDIVTRLEVESGVKVNTGTRYFKGIVPSLGQSSKPFLESAIGFWKMKFQQMLMPAIGSFPVNQLLTHEFGHLLLGQGFTRHGEFTANFWPYAVHGSSFYSDFVRIQRNQSIFEVVTLHEALGLVLTPEQRQFHKNQMDLSLKRRISSSIQNIGLEKYARPLSPRHVKIVRDGMVERINAMSIPDEDKKLLIEQIDREINNRVFIIRPELAGGYEVAPGNEPRPDIFDEEERQQLIALGFDPDLQEHQYRSSEVTSRLFMAYNPYIAIPPRLFGWQRASADDRGARSSSGPRTREPKRNDVPQPKKFTRYGDDEEIIKLIEQGLSVTEIASQLGRSQQNMSIKIRRLQKAGRVGKVARKVRKVDDLTINRRIARKKRLDAYVQYHQNLINGMSRAEAIDAFIDAMGDEDFRVTSERATAETRFNRKAELLRLLEIVNAGAAPDEMFYRRRTRYNEYDYILVNEMKLLGFSARETSEQLGIVVPLVNAYRQLHYRTVNAKQLTDKEFNADIDALARAITGRGARSQSSGGTRTPSQILAEGPKELLYGRDADGIPIVGTIEQSKSRYGDSKRKVERYFLRKYGIQLKVAKSMFDEEKYPEFHAAGYGALQALEELLMNIPGFKKLAKGNDIEFVISDGGFEGRSDLDRQRRVLGSFGPVPNLFRSYGFRVGDRTRTQYTINLDKIRWKTESFMYEWFQEGHQQGRLVVKPTIVSDIFSLFGLPTVTEDMFTPATSIRGLINREFLREPYQEAANIVASRTAYGTAIHEFGHFLDYSLRDPNPVLRMPSKLKLLFDTYITRKYEKLVDEQGNPRRPTAEDLFGDVPQSTYQSYKRRATQMALTQVTRYGASSPTESLAEAWAAWWLFARAPVIRTHPELSPEITNPTPEQTASIRFPQPIADTAVPLIRPLIFDLGTNIKSAELQEDIIGDTIEPLVALFAITPFLDLPKKKTKKKTKK